MADSKWKRAERQVAALLGGHRVWHERADPVPPLLGPGHAVYRQPRWVTAALAAAGRRTATRPNVVAGSWRLQVRLRTPLPRWLADAMRAALRTCQKDGRPGVVLITASQGKAADRWVLVPLPEFRGLLHRAGELPTAATDDEDAAVPDRPPPPPPPLFDLRNPYGYLSDLLPPPNLATELLRDRARTRSMLGFPGIQKLLGIRVAFDGAEPVLGTPDAVRRSRDSPSRRRPQPTAPHPVRLAPRRAFRARGRVAK